MAMKERDLIQSFMGDMADQFKAGNVSGFFWHKVADFPVSRLGGRSFSGPKRFVDVFGCMGGKAFAIEWKLHKALTAFPIGNVTDEQVAALREFEDAGGISLVGIGQIVKLSNYSEKQIERDHVKPQEISRGWLYRVYLMHVGRWGCIEDDTEGKSVRLSQSFIEPINKTTVNGCTRWDVTAFLGVVC